MIPLASSTITPGFADPVIAGQQTFRAALTAMAHPGRIVTIAQEIQPPDGMDIAAAALALTLLDHEAPLWLDAGLGAAESYLRFHCGCPIVGDCDQAQYAIIAQPHDFPPLDSFHQGSDEYPDESATLIVQVDELGNDGPLRLTGPGIAETAFLGIAGLKPNFWPEWQANHAAFPRGIDIFFTRGPRLCGLPRTTIVRS